MKHKNNPQLERLLAIVRNQATRGEEFRATLEKIGEYLGYEIARRKETEQRSITTSLGETATHTLLKENPILIALLRAGLPIYNGLQKAFPEAEAGFIGTMRDEHTLKSKISYTALPLLTGKQVILADTMLATGGSLIDSIEFIKPQKPASITIIAAIASRQGMQRIHAYESGIEIYAAAIDPTLNAKGYIVPGLGDAGDRCYGVKQ